jgi:hypothetical protein
MSDEQIEAVRHAVLNFKCTCEQRSIVCSRCEARAAIAAYRPEVERMVREAIKRGASLGYDSCESRMAEDEYDARTSAIFQSVMGAG